LVKLCDRLSVGVSSLFAVLPPLTVFNSDSESSIPPALPGFARVSGLALFGLSLDIASISVWPMIRPAPEMIASTAGAANQLFHEKR
jgi:hypothetical protein